MEEAQNSLVEVRSCRLCVETLEMLPGSADGHRPRTQGRRQPLALVQAVWEWKRAGLTATGPFPSPAQLSLLDGGKHVGSLTCSVQGWGEGRAEPVVTHLDWVASEGWSLMGHKYSQLLNSQGKLPLCWSLIGSPCSRETGRRKKGKRLYFL